MTELREQEASSPGGWEKGRGRWSPAQGGCSSGMSRASRAGDRLGPGNRGTGSGIYEQV